MKVIYCQVLYLTQENVMAIKVAFQKLFRQFPKEAQTHGWLVGWLQKGLAILFIWPVL